MFHNRLDNWDMRFHEKVTKFIERKGMSDRKVAKVVGGVSATTVGRWQTGESTPRFDEAWRLARLLDVSMDFLADDALDEPPVGLSDAQKELLRLAARIGVEDAIDRLLIAYEIKPSGPTWAELKRRDGSGGRPPG